MLSIIRLYFFVFLVSQRIINQKILCFCNLYSKKLSLVSNYSFSLNSLITYFFYAFSVSYQSHTYLIDLCSFISSLPAFRSVMLFISIVSLHFCILFFGQEANILNFLCMRLWSLDHQQTVSSIISCPQS